MQANAGALAKSHSDPEPGIRQTKNFRKYLAQVYILSPERGTFTLLPNQISMNLSDRTTIRLSSSRSYARLAYVIKSMNENMYAEEIFKEDRIDFQDRYDQNGELTHFEITGSPLDFFQIGLRYGSLEENDKLKGYLKDSVRDIFTKKMETNEL
jgi:hypothetical protein